jgi:hypothetical protein
MELHPLRQLSCPGLAMTDVRAQLQTSADLGYNDADVIDRIVDSFRLWIRRSEHPDAPEATAIAFDYWKCDGPDGTRCSNRGPVPNFARFSARLLDKTVRCAGGGANGEQFKTAIARIRPISGDGEQGPRWRLTKLYALDGTDFYGDLGGCTAGGHPTTNTFDLTGIFTLDPLAVIKQLDRIPAGNTDWAEVPFPLAFIVFGKTTTEDQ